MPKNRGLKKSDPTHFQTVSLSHRGYHRKNNEDRLAIQGFIASDDVRRPILLAVLADGVGGHRAGETASRVGVEEVIDAVSSAESLDHPSLILENAVERANRKVLEASEADPEKSGMGSTCVCALVIEDRLFIANLGDSRAYLIRNGKISQLTYDHTWLEEIGGGNSSKYGESNRNHPFAHVLNRYLGSSEPVRVDMRIRTKSGVGTTENHNGSLKLLVGDRILLCSDGLTDLLGDEEILRIAVDGPVRKSAQKLIYCALQKGGHDNISVILIEYPG